MQGRRVLAAALAVGMAIGPVTAAAVTLGALVSPAFAQGAHHGRTGTRRHHGVAPTTRTVRGVATSGVSGTSFTIALTARPGRGRGAHERGRHRSSTTTTSIVVQFDTNTVFVDRGTPSATIQDIAPLDRIIVVWSASPGTALTSLPAASKVIDLGPPPPIRYRAAGLAAENGSPTGVLLTVSQLRPNAAPAFTLSTDLPVTFDAGTVFVDPGNPGATLGSIAQGDRLIVVWSAPPGTPAVGLPAASRVIDLGQPTG